jgi:hypothetical protein
MPGTALELLLLAAGDATWVAGPRAKGANLYHGTGGNGYAQWTGDLGFAVYLWDCPRGAAQFPPLDVFWGD